MGNQSSLMLEVDNFNNSDVQPCNNMAMHFYESDDDNDFVSLPSSEEVTTTENSSLDGSNSSSYNSSQGAAPAAGKQKPQSSSSCSSLAFLFGQRQSSFVALQAEENEDEDDGKEDEEECISRSYTQTPYAIRFCTLPTSTIDQQQQHNATAVPRRSFSWSSSLSTSSLDGYYTAEEMKLSATTPTRASDLRKNPRPIWIVTTAALPWQTGTAVNPLLRAAALCSYYKKNAATVPPIHLVVPWLIDPADRETLYGPEFNYITTSEQQEEYLKNWLREAATASSATTDASDMIQYHWYPAKYHASMGSIFALGDVCASLDASAVSGDAVCLLEEPEHMNYYRAPGKCSWTDTFQHVVGIIHTNYQSYARQRSVFAAPLVGALSAWMVRAYCDQVIKLSGTLQEYAPEKEVISNVHGIREAFLKVPPPTGNRVYFLGKLTWAKGLDTLLLQYQSLYRKQTGQYLEMDVFGSGPDQEEMEKCCQKNHPLRRLHRRQEDALPVRFLGRWDHLQLPSDYKIFVNPSVTEVLCTTTAEAVAMGKFVILPRHPSNTFFESFPNCLFYTNANEFTHFVQYAKTHDPLPLTETEQYTLTWEAAVDRLLDAAAISERDDARRHRVGGRKWQERYARAHYELARGTHGDVLRKVLGGGPVALQSQYISSN